jgi:hypothetical protein
MIEYLLKRLSTIPSDKVMHFAVGVVLFAVLLPFVGSITSMAVVATAAVGKEIYDYLNKDNHTPDVWDALATIAGGGVGLLCVVLAK